MIKTNHSIKILYFFNETNSAMSKWQRVHFFDELKHHNCEIRVYNSLNYNNIYEANDKIVEEIRSYSPDIFMTGYNERIVFIDTIQKIKSMGVPTLLICCDNLLVPFVHLKVAKYYDLVWLTSIETKHLFDKTGANTIFLPYAANPYIKGIDEKINGIGFMGSPYGSRVNMINNFTKHNIDIYCHYKAITNDVSDINDNKNVLYLVYEFLKFKEGRKLIKGAMVNKLNSNNRLLESNYLHSEYRVSFDDLYKTYSKYALSLSSTSARNTGVLKHPLDVVNLRNFEIPMSGGIQFCRYTKEMSEYFENDKEIVMYKSDDEMIDKAMFYLNDNRKDLRNKIRIAARKKAETYHTWWNRFNTIFNILNLRVSNYAF